MLRARARPTESQPPFGSRRRAAAAAVVLAVLVVLIAPMLYARHYGDVVYPGVTVLGAPLGGLAPAEAAAVIAGKMPSGSSALVLRDPGRPEDPADDRTWSVPRYQLGLVPDPAMAADVAYQQGRGGLNYLAPVWIRVRGRAVPVSDLFDAATARATLDGLAAKVDVPPVNGDVRLQAGELVIRQPESGRQLDVEATLARLAALAADPVATQMDLVTTGTAPRFQDVNAVANAYRLAVSGPVHLTWRQGQELTAPVQQVKAWVTIAPRPSPNGDMVPSIVFDQSAIAAWLGQSASQVDQNVRDVRLAYDEGTGKITVIEPSQPGQTLDVAASVGRFEQAAYTDVRTAELAVVTESPAVASDVVPELEGKVRVLARASTRISGQEVGRGLNILLAASRLDGVTLAPDEEFSYNRALGTVSVADGFDMVQVDGAGGDVLGGGIEQVATGLFRAALWSGLVITERHAPPWRAAWSEPPIGLDAAVSPPGADLRFVNGTAGHLIFGCRVDAGRGALVTTVIGAPPEREVELTGPLVEALSPPQPPSSRTDARLPAGRAEQVEWARHGGQVSYQRVVRSEGTELFRDAFVSRYQASGDVVVAGSGP